jgi:hopanoid biosynthesis associated protein HpnK
MNSLNNGFRYLVFAADDLGRSVAVNEAVLDAYESGVLTAASMMAGGEAFSQAAGFVQKISGLSIGLHVTLCDGKAVLPHASIPDLAGADGNFAGRPAGVWIKLGRKEILRQATLEIEAQFNRIEEAGITPCYVDSHHHLHMHPGLFGLICRIASDRGVSWIRIPNEPITIVFRFGARGRGVMPLLEQAVFGTLKASNMRTAERYGLRCASNVYGLSRSGALDEEYLLSLINHMAMSHGSFVNEIFCHPDVVTDAGLAELSALKSVAVVAKLESFSIKRIGYKDID